MNFFNMMLAEGFIAMVWSAATMGMIGLGAKNAGITMQFEEGSWQFCQELNGSLQEISPTSVVGVICRNALGNGGGMIATLGVILLPITTGDTALRSLRLIIGEAFHIKQDSNKNRLMVAVPIAVVVLGILIVAKFSPNGFNLLWQYMGGANQTISIFAFAAIMV